MGREVQYLEDHALTKEQAQAVVLEMDKGTCKILPVLGDVVGRGECAV